MIKVKVSEASDVVLDYMVAIALGGTEPWFDTVNTYWIKIDGKDRALSTKWSDQQNFAPSTLWAHGGPIIEREGITVMKYTDKCVDIVPEKSWYSCTQNHWGDYDEVEERGPTSLVAAMRCFVISKLGAEVEVPEELVRAS